MPPACPLAVPVAALWVGHDSTGGETEAASASGAEPACAGGDAGGLRLGEEEAFGVVRGAGSGRPAVDEQGGGSV